MKNNFKIYKNALLLAGGITLAHTISYSVCAYGLNTDPFKHREYDLYRVDYTKYTKDGVSKSSNYQSIHDEDSLVFTKGTSPYLDKPYKINANNFSDEQIKFITENINIPGALLSDEYISDLLTSDIKENIEQYDVEYTKIDVDKNDIEHYVVEPFSPLACTYYSVLMGAIFLDEIVIYNSLKKHDNVDGNKILSKNDKKFTKKYCKNK